MTNNAEFKSHDHLPWTEVAGFDQPGIEEKILYRDKRHGTYARLLRLAPGFKSGDKPLKHEFDETVWILDGYSINGRTGDRSEARMFAVFPAGMEHGPFIYPEGALFLEFRHYLKG